MKRYLLSVLALTLIFALLPVSDSAAQLKWSGGVKGGINMANFSGDDADDSKMKIGAVGGAFVTVGITELFSVQVEGLYVQKGAKWEDTHDTETVETKEKNDYIEFPVLAVVSFAAAEKMNVNVFAGPAISILVSAKEEDEDIKDYLKSLDFGAAFGAGFTYAMDAFTFLLEGRYTLGLTEIHDLTDAELETFMMTENPSIKNSNISIMAGFAIPFGGAAE
jgi:hypothetical protein